MSNEKKIVQERLGNLEKALLEEEKKHTKILFANGGFFLSTIGLLGTTLYTLFKGYDYSGLTLMGSALSLGILAESMSIHSEIDNNIIHYKSRIERHYDMLKELSDTRRIPVYDMDKKPTYMADLKK